MTTAPEFGCIFAGHLGQYIYGEVFDLAVAYGWEPGEWAMVDRKFAYDPECDQTTRNQCWDALVDPYGGWADKAEDYLNEHVAAPFCFFGWHDGEFFYHSANWWREVEEEVGDGDDDS